MKKLVLLVVSALVIITCACNDMPGVGCKGGKTIRSMQKSDIEQLKKQAAKYESDKNKMEEHSSRLSDIYFKLGEKYLEKRLWDLAIASFEKSISYGKNTAFNHYSLAIAMANRGRDLKSDRDIEAAEYQYRRALEINGDFPDAIYGLSILLFYEKKEKEEGLNLMEKLVAGSPTYYRAHFALGRFYYETNQLKKALTVYENLYSELEKKSSDSSTIREYREKCKENIQLLMQELS